MVVTNRTIALQLIAVDSIGSLVLIFVAIKSFLTILFVTPMIISTGHLHAGFVGFRTRACHFSFLAMLISPLRIFTTLVVAAVVGVSAQDTCILNCLQSSLSSSTCTSYTDLTCVCSNTAFQTAAETCLKASCTAADQATALQLQEAECGSSSSNSSSNSTSSKASSATSTSTSTSASSTSTKSSNGAVHEQVPFLKSAIALAAVALGGAFIL